MKDAVETMGAVLPEDAGGRDAVHVAVFSAVSRGRLFPGQGVSIVEMDGRDAIVSSAGNAVAIVDPFLTESVQAGGRFWAYLYPRTITALSHRWSHPAFEDVASTYMPPTTRLASERWLRDFVSRSDCPGYEAVVAAAAEVADGNGYGEYLIFGTEAHGEIPPEFWDHAEAVLGRPIQGTRAKYFSCSC